VIKEFSFIVCVVLGSAMAVAAQSTDIAYPTALTESQLSGQIRARDLGDPRLTTYYYTFNGAQGDLFVNVLTKNLSGSIDVFAADGMRPLTRITVYADLSSSETGRVVYLRKPEKLILRIEGRTPNDDPAEFQIKFAGGFEAAVPKPDEPPVPKVGDLPVNESGIRVNSVGTIIAVVPKSAPSPKAEPSDVRRSETAETEKNDDAPVVTEAKKESEQPKSRPEKTKEETSPTVSTRNRSANRSNRKSTPSTTRATKTVGRGDSTTAKPDDNPASSENTRTGKKPPRVVVTDETKAVQPKADPLENVRLVIIFKDGTKVERPMTEVLRFTADQSTLTIVNKNGRTARFSILEVASVSIQ
jgi:hypothetical protein